MDEASARTLLTAQSRPYLPRHIRLREDKARGVWIILAPERVFNPDPIAVAVLQLCDGERSLAMIAERLARDYDAAAETVLADIIDMLQQLADKGVVKA